MTLEEKVEFLEKEIQKLKDIEEIKALKGKYFRCLDGKDWEGLASTMSPNLVTSYSDGKLVFHGPQETVDYLAKCQPPEEITMHIGHTPEITIEDETHATGRWYLQDHLIFTKESQYPGHSVEGSAFYTDRYEKIDGRWYILETGYQRVYEEHYTRDPKRKITINMFQK